MNKNMIYENMVNFNDGTIRDNAPLFTLKDFPSAVGAVMCGFFGIVLSVGVLQVLTRIA